MGKLLIKSLERVINNVSTKSNDVLHGCLSHFNCVVSDGIHRRKMRFLIKLKQSDNSLCRLFVTKIADEITAVEQCHCLHN